jgi:transposase InsO family protein
MWWWCRGRSGFPLVSWRHRLRRNNGDGDTAEVRSEFELLRDYRFATRERARTAVAGWIDEYNTVRRHSTDNMLSPLDYERTQATTTQATAETRAAREAA